MPKNIQNYNKTSQRVRILGGYLVFTFPKVLAIYIANLDT